MNGVIKKFTNTYKFCSNDINKFILLLWKVIDPYENIDSFERFNETALQNRKGFFKVNYNWKILLMKIIYMLRNYFKNLN